MDLVVSCQADWPDENNNYFAENISALLMENDVNYLIGKV